MGGMDLEGSGEHPDGSVIRPVVQSRPMSP